MKKTGWEVLAWVIMDNHYHWLLRTPKPNLVAGMSWFQGTYTQRYNARHRVWGHLFGGRYKAIPVQPQENGRGDYLKTLMDYIHLNPVRAKMVDSEHGLGLLEYRWSSLAQGYGLLPKKRSKWLKVEEGLRIFDLPDTAAGRRRFIQRLEERARKEKQKECGLPSESVCKGVNGVRVQLLDRCVPLADANAWHAAFAFNPPGRITTSWPGGTGARTFFMMMTIGGSSCIR